MNWKKKKNPDRTDKTWGKMHSDREMIPWSKLDNLVDNNFTKRDRKHKHVGLQASNKV